MRNRILAGGLAALLVAGGLAVGVAAPASAHTPAVTATCSTIDINLQNYSTKPSQNPATLTVENPDYVPAVPEVAEVLGDAPLISAEVAQVEHTEWRYVPVHGSQEHWSAKDAGAFLVYDWTLYKRTGETRVVVDVPFQAAVYGEHPVITPYQAAIPAVGTETIEVANPDHVPGDAQPNRVTVIVDGVDVIETTFGTSYVNSVPIDGTKGHSYTVKVRAWDDPSGSKGWSNNFTGKTKACPPENITVPDLTVLPPTCDADGSLPFLNNPPAQNPNGYEFPGQGFRVYLDRAFDGAGTYTATLQKVGPGFDPAFPYGTKITGGSTTQILTVDAATGYQDTDPNAPCYVEVPEDTRENGEWSTPEVTCENEVGDEITITRSYTETTYTLNTETGKVEAASSTGTEEGVYVVTQEDIDALDCPVPPVDTPDEEEVVPAGGDDLEFLPTLDELAQTGSPAEQRAILLTAGGLSLALIAVIATMMIVAHRRRVAAEASETVSE